MELGFPYWGFPTVIQNATSRTLTKEHAQQLLLNQLPPGTDPVESIICRVQGRFAAQVYRNNRV
jgi:hypothetical protein